MDTTTLTTTAAPTTATVTAPAASLPAPRPRRTLIRGARVLAMDGRADDGSVADVLIENGVIRDVAAELTVGDAEIIDATDRIAIPGLVDTHRHVWQTQLRGIGGDWTLFDYLVHARNIYSPRYEPTDAYAGAYAGYLEALDAGITTLVDYAHVMASPEHADALVDAMQRSHIRGVLAYGTTHIPVEGQNTLRAQVESTWQLDDIRRLRADRLPTGDGRVSLGIASSDMAELLPIDVTRRELDLGRELGLRRITLHSSSGAASRSLRFVRRLRRSGLLGPDLLFVHGNGWAPDELRAVADSGGSLSSTPETELQMGMGLPVLARAQRCGIPTGLGVDVVSGNGGDLFAQMRLALQATRFAANDRIVRSGRMPRHLTTTAADVLRAATVDGARAAGLDHVTGTLTPGKAADVVLLRADRFATAPVNDAVGTVVLQATPADVDTVLVGGQVVKRGGNLLGVDRRAVLRQVEASRQRIVADVDPRVVAAVETALAGALPVDRRGAVMTRFAGALLRREPTASLLLRMLLPQFEPEGAGR